MYQDLFSHDKIDFEVLRQRASGMRWGTLPADVIPLTSADPDFKPAKEIREEMIRYIQGGYFPYASFEGIPGLRETLANAELVRNNVPVRPEYIIAVDSAAAALHAVATSILEPGDEAIIFDPVDLLFGISVRYAGATPVCYPSIYENGRWKLDDLESYITPKTKMICLCNPHNPLGYLYSKEDLQIIAELANKYNLWIMNDEVWSDIVYSEKPFTSINTLGEELNRRTITCYGFSKGFALPGLRAGYIYVRSQEALEKVSRICNHHSYGVDVVTQVAMKTACGQCYYWVDAFRAHLQQMRDLMFDRLSAMPMVDATKQEATFVTFPNVARTGMTSAEFADFCLKECRVAIVPGTVTWFGPRAEGHVRFCFSSSREVLTEAMDRVERGLIQWADKKNLG